MLAAFLERLDATIENDLEMGKVPLQLRGDVIAQRWHFAVLFRRQPFEDGNARMHGEAAATGFLHLADEIAELGIAVATIDADAMLDRHVDAHGVAHRFHAVGHQCGMCHQAGADQVVLHTVAGAADVEVHLVVASRLGHSRAGRQVRRHAAAQLQRQRVLGLVVAQKARSIAIDQRARGHHLGIEQGMAGELTQKVAAVVICPVHHRRHAEAAGRRGAPDGGVRLALRLHVRYLGLQQGAALYSISAASCRRATNAGAKCRSTQRFITRETRHNPSLHTPLYGSRAFAARRPEMKKPFNLAVERPLACVGKRLPSACCAFA